MIEDEMKTDILFREELFKSTALSPEKTLEELRKIEKIPTYVAFVNKGVQIPSIQESNYKIQDVLVEGKVNSDIRKAMFETSVKLKIKTILASFYLCLFKNERTYQMVFHSSSRKTPRN